MHTERDCLANRLTPSIFIQTLFVEPVSCLVEDAKKGTEKIRLIVPRRQSRIERSHPGAERMNRCVDTSGLKIEANRFRDFSIKCLLKFDRIMSGKLRTIHGFLRGGGLHDWQKILSQRTKRLVETPRRCSPFESIHQGIIKPIIVTPALRLFPTEENKLFQPGFE